TEKNASPCRWARLTLCAGQDPAASGVRRAISTSYSDIGHNPRLRRILRIGNASSGYHTAELGSQVSHRCSPDLQPTHLIGTYKPRRRQFCKVARMWLRCILGT